MDNDIFSGETFHQKNEVLNKMFEDIFNIKEINTQIEMELEITKILNYFLDMRQDYLLENLKNIFVEVVNDHDLFSLYKEKRIKQKEIIDLLEGEEVFKSITKKLLPEIFLTGTTLDTEDEIMKEEKNSKIKSNLIPMMDIFKK